jgi:hypothetical protein
LEAGYRTPRVAPLYVPLTVVTWQFCKWSLNANVWMRKIFRSNWPRPSGGANQKEIIKGEGIRCKRLHNAFLERENTSERLTSKLRSRQLKPRAQAAFGSTKMIRLEIVEGRDLLLGDVDAILVNTVLAAKSPQMKVGSIMSFRMGPELTSWRLVGVVREFWPPPVAYT